MVIYPVVVEVVVDAKDHFAVAESSYASAVDPVGLCSYSSHNWY